MSGGGAGGGAKVAKSSANVRGGPGRVGLLRLPALVVVSVFVGGVRRRGAARHCETLVVVRGDERVEQFPNGAKELAERVDERARHPVCVCVQIRGETKSM